MGICEANSSPNPKKPTKEERLKEAYSNLQKQKAERQNQSGSKTNLPDLSEKFNDFPCWEGKFLMLHGIINLIYVGERYKGEGIKRMKGYICELKNDELVALRDEFWKYKESLDPNNKKMWKAIRQSTLMDYGRFSLKLLIHYLEKASTYLTSNGIKTANGCLNHLIDPTGRDIRIPNFCINEPYMEKQLHEKENMRTFHLIKVNFNFINV